MAKRKKKIDVCEMASRASRLIGKGIAEGAYDGMVAHRMPAATLDMLDDYMHDHCALDAFRLVYTPPKHSSKAPKRRR